MKFILAQESSGAMVWLAEAGHTMAFSCKAAAERAVLAGIRPPRNLQVSVSIRPPRNAQVLAAKCVVNRAQKKQGEFGNNI